VTNPQKKSLVPFVPFAFFVVQDFEFEMIAQR